MTKICELKSALLIVSAVLFFLNPVAAEAKTRFVSIGTGGITGVYYPTGNAIARMVNDKKAIYGIRATVESTAGSVYNVNALMSGDIDFGIVQSDRQYQAVSGLAEWADKGPQKNLRAVFNLHPESVTLLASAKSEIKTISDLKGKRVNIGNPGSGQRQNSLDALSLAGLDWKTDILTENVKASEAPGLLQDGRIDAFFYTVGHPSGAIKEATAGATPVRFVEISGTPEFFSRFPFYSGSEINIKHYPGAINKTDISTFGVKATLLTSAAVKDDIVYAFTREVFENLEAFKNLHPAYEVLTRENMLEGISAPLHPGALKYYKEVGLK